MPLEIFNTRYADPPRGIINFQIKMCEIEKYYKMQLDLGMDYVCAVEKISTAPPTAILYRNGVGDANMIIHVATFDAEDGWFYNWSNCLIARSLFQSQPGEKVDYWCER